MGTFTARHRLLGCWILTSTATTMSKTFCHLYFSILLYVFLYICLNISLYTSACSWLNIWIHWASDHALHARVLRIFSFLSASPVCLNVIHHMYHTYTHTVTYIYIYFFLLRMLVPVQYFTFLVQCRVDLIQYRDLPPTNSYYVAFENHMKLGISSLLDSMTIASRI